MYDERLLRNPDPSDLARKKIIPLSRFTDDDIYSMDYASWAATESRYEWHPEDRTQMEKLVEDIERNGLRKKIEIAQHGGRLHVSDGHHRVIALRKHLGWTHIPYRWFVVDHRTGLYGPRYRRDLLPDVPRETKETP